MAKRGRPRRQRPDKDYGTPELVAKRMALLGPDALKSGADVTMCEHPLGLLFVRGYLAPNEDQGKRMYDAGLRFGICWGRAFKPPFAQSQLAAMSGPMGVGEGGDREGAVREVREISGAMKDRQVYDALVNTVVYRRMCSGNNLARLRTALCRLIEYFRQAEREAA